MYSRRVKRLPVTDADGRLVGIVAWSDADIRHEITQDVMLNGFLTDASRHVEGVVAVRDRLSYPSAEQHGVGPLF